MRRALGFVSAILLGALPFACTEDFTGRGGGLPGDQPSPASEAGAADSARDRAEAQADAFVADVGAEDSADAD